MRTSKPLALGGGNSNLTPLLACAATLLLALDLHATDRFVSPTGSHSPPFTDWSGAATNIQAAIDAAAAGDVVWVTNGVYDTGGRAIYGSLTNRVALWKALTVQSVNGADATVIEGRWDAAKTNGPTSIRCAWVTNGAVLRGFTLRRGANYGATGDSPYGGGVAGASTNARVERCVLTNNTTQVKGGGAWNILLQDCLITGNTAPTYGGGAGNSVLQNCVVSTNNAPQGGGGVDGCRCENSTLIGNTSNYGGAASYSTLNNCRLLANRASIWGGAAYGGTLNNSAITGNQAGKITGGPTPMGGGTYGAALNNCTVTGNKLYSQSMMISYAAGVHNGSISNCIVWANHAVTSYGTVYTNNCFNLSTASYSCTASSLNSPAVTGTGVISVDPLLLPDGIHVATNSPCRGTGSASYASGTDLDGQPWQTPPSMGCDEQGPEPVIAGGPALVTSTNAENAWLSVTAAGEPPFNFLWWKNGQLIQDSAHYSNAGSASVSIQGLDWGDTGAYQAAISNAHGWATSTVMTVAIRCVDAASAAPTAPFTNWVSAATNIQDAIEMAGPGDLILVTNGVYATGGKAVYGTATNRVVLDKPITVLSVHGPEVTTIQGSWDPATTNGPLSVRAVWMEDGSTLSGFTVCNGSTKDSGGGVYCRTLLAGISGCVLSNNASSGSDGGGAIRFGTVSDSLLIGNRAAWSGGGASGSYLMRCALVGNAAGSGGGLKDSYAVNCRLERNTASGSGGAIYGGTAQNSLIRSNKAGSNGGGMFTGYLVNCLVTGNSATSYGGIMSSDPGGLTNSIVWGNFSTVGSSSSNGSAFFGAYSLIAPNPPNGPGNLSVNPQLVDGLHLAATSPCRGKGNPAYASGLDLEGRTWANPPSMGCVEVVENEFAGPLGVSLLAGRPEIAATGGLPLTAQVSGRASRLEWDFGDGLLRTNLGFQVIWSWPVPGNYAVTVRAFNNDHPDGVESTITVTVVPCEAPVLSLNTPQAGIYDLTFPSQFGVPYRAEYATNLSSPIFWSLLSARTSDGSVIWFRDTQPTNTAKFYRICTQ